MRSRHRLGAFLPAVLLFTACPTRTVYYPDGGAGGAGGSGGVEGGQAGGSGGAAEASGSGGAGGLAGGEAGGAPVGGVGGTAGTSGASGAGLSLGGASGQAGSIACGARLAVTEASIGVPGGGNDQFGTAVAARNGVMLVTAPSAAGGIGRAYAFSGSGSSYSYVQFVAPNGGAVSTYARALALDSTGSTAVVAGSADGATGTAWIFTRTTANWFAGPSVLPPDFFTGLAVEGGTVVLGGLYVAYAYATSGGTPQMVTPTDFTPNNTNGFFQAPAAMSGDTLLVTGEPLDSSGVLGHFGYVFVKSGTGWSQQAKLVPSDLASSNNPHFHFSVALEGTTAILATSSGAYVFVRAGSTWSETQKLPPQGTREFGAAVDLSGNVLVISAISTSGEAGAAYVYARAGNSWVAGPVLTSAANGDLFGSSVAVSQGTIAVGAPLSGADGAVFLFSCQPTP